MEYKEINIKPISVNDMYKWKFVSSPKAKRFKQSMLNEFYDDEDRENTFNTDWMKKLDIVIYFSNKWADIDWPLKILIDSIQQIYGFNDNKVYELNVKKRIVKKGEERIKFNITDLPIDYNYKD